MKKIIHIEERSGTKFECEVRAKPQVVDGNSLGSSSRRSHKHREFASNRRETKQPLHN